MCFNVFVFSFLCFLFAFLLTLFLTRTLSRSNTRTLSLSQVFALHLCSVSRQMVIATFRLQRFFFSISMFPLSLSLSLSLAHPKSIICQIFFCLLLCLNFLLIFLFAPEFFANVFFWFYFSRVFLQMSFFFCFVTLLIHGLLRSSSVFFLHLSFLHRIFSVQAFLGSFSISLFPFWIRTRTLALLVFFSSSVYKYINLGLFFFVLR